MCGLVPPSHQCFAGHTQWVRQMADKSWWGQVVHVPDRAHCLRGQCDDQNVSWCLSVPTTTSGSGTKTWVCAMPKDAVIATVVGTTGSLREP